jgi:hypothetical protein
LIGEDGRVYEARGWDRIGAHTYKWNDCNADICISQKGIFSGLYIIFQHSRGFRWSHWFAMPKVVPCFNQFILHQRFLVDKLMVSLRRFYDCHNYLVNRYGMAASVSWMTKDIFRLS